MKLFKEALQNAGYERVTNLSLEEQIKDCFLDYVDAGTWSNLTLDDVDDITVEQMARALKRM